LKGGVPLVLDRIEREIVIAAPAEKVYAALTEARHTGTWFGGAGIDLGPGGLLSCTWENHGTYLAPHPPGRTDPPRLLPPSA
jgi:uncharacterized protein YndB with AHSA1/START domain